MDNASHSRNGSFKILDLPEYAFYDNLVVEVASMEIELDRCIASAQQVNGPKNG